MSIFRTISLDKFENVKCDVPRDGVMAMNHYPYRLLIYTDTKQPSGQTLYRLHAKRLDNHKSYWAPDRVPAGLVCPMFQNFLRRGVFPQSTALTGAHAELPDRAG